MIKLPEFAGRIVNAARTALANPAHTRYVPFPVRQSGITVDADTALTVSAYYRALVYISGQIAGLPWDVIREGGGRTKKLTNHPVWKILHRRANDEVGPFTWRETMVAWALSWGDGISEIERDYMGRPLALHLISPDRVEIVRGFLLNNGEFQLSGSGGIYYKISNSNGEPTYLPASDVFHLHGLGFDGLRGYSVIKLMTRSLGLTIAAEQNGSDFFQNGLVSTGALKHPKKLSEPAYDRLKKWIQDKSKFGNRWTPPILEEGMDWLNMTIPPEDAQMLETRLFQVSEVARWLGLPPHKLADLSRATFSNIESQSIEIVNDCFMPWIHRLEEEANWKLFTGREQGVKTKINVRGLLRGDDASRSAYYKTMWEIGAYSNNDILRLEDMDEIGPEGDQHLVQLNITTLKRIKEGTPQQGNGSAAKPDEGPNKFEEITEDAIARCLRRESNRFAQNRHKINDIKELSTWFVAFSEQHKEYMFDALRPIVNLIMQTRGVSGTAEIDTFVCTHLEDSLQRFVRIVSGAETEFDIESRSKREAKDLIGLVCASITRAKQ